MKTYTIYARSRDYPDCFVLRAFDVSAASNLMNNSSEKCLPNGAIPTDEVKMASSLSEIRALVPSECVRASRQPEDDPVIVETWF